jgi:tetratricopeptide (TPR) repeat protein
MGVDFRDCSSQREKVGLLDNPVPGPEQSYLTDAVSSANLMKSLSAPTLLTLTLGVQVFANFQQNQDPAVSRKSDASSKNTIDRVVGKEKDLQRARQLLGKGSAAEAASLLQHIVERDAHNAEAQLLLGTALALVPQRSKAIAALRQAIELRPDFAPGYNTLGMTLGRFGEPDAARQAFEKALELDPRFVEAHVNLALILAQRKEFSRAADHLGHAIAIQGKSVAAGYSHYLLGKVLNEQDQPQAAVQQFERAIELRPNYAEAYLDLGLTQRKLSESSDFMVALKKAAELAPNNPTARYQLGKEYLSRGMPEKALVQLREAARLQPRDRAILYSLDRALLSSGKAEEASLVEEELKEILQSANELRIKTLEATRLNNEGVELEKAGNLTAALEKYKSAVDLDPLHGGYRRNLALGLCRLGKWEQGIAELREVLKRDPDDEEATKALYIALEKAPPEKTTVPREGNTKSDQP